MFEVLGKNYYVDVDRLIERCRPERVKEPEGDESGEEPQQIELNVFKYEVYKTCLERVLSDYESDEEDQVMARITDKASNPSFGLSFNTLLKSQIIKEDE